MSEEQKESTDFIIGRHAVTEALKTDQSINKLFLQDALKSDGIKDIVKLARDRGIVISNVPKTKLDLFRSSKTSRSCISNFCVSICRD